MCVAPDNKKQQSAGMKMPPSSFGSRLDKAQRDASSASGGGTYGGGTILSGVPRNTDVDAQRKTTLLGV